MDQSIWYNLFKTSQLPPHKIESAVQKCHSATALSPAFWKSLQQDPEFSDGIAEELRFTAELGELTGYHLPLVRELQRRRRHGTIRTVADLLALDWNGVFKEPTGDKPIEAPRGTPGKSKAEQEENFARTLSVKASAMFPTAAIARAIKKERDDAKKSLGRFFEENPAFDFRTAGIDAYLADTPDALDKIAPGEAPDLVRQLKQMERLFGLTDGAPNQYAAMRRLIDDGLDSAQAIAGMGEEAFCNKYPEDLSIIKNPRAVHAKASQRAATAMALFAKYSRQYNSVEVAAIGQNIPTSVAQNAMYQAQATAPTGHTPYQCKGNGNGGSGNGTIKIPDWEKLFGSLNRCECKHCRSVLSPSAYLVDLLALLDKLKLNRNEQVTTALKVLLDRRPDISEIKLSCANSDTTLPYVDLVNEVLENAVFPLKFYITEDAENDNKIQGICAELDRENISETLKGEFDNNKRKLNGPNIKILSEKTKWQITDSGYRYIIEAVLVDSKNQLKVTVKPPCAQTNGAADDLGANPEHLNVDVYNALKEKIFPWAVPFDLWAEEARVYLDHLGVPRHRLMELFLMDEDKEISVATEYFGLTQKEKQLLTNGAPETPWQAWGEDKEKADGKSWIDTLKEVPVFLERSGLSYTQLTDLIETRYINPDKKIEIRFPVINSPEERITTSPCDYTQATINWPDIDAQSLLYKAHCFLRLQRKTGWSIREFDKILKALGYAEKSFDAELLVGLRHVHELQNDLSVPIEELLSWFASIDTDPGVDGGPSLYDRLFLNRSVQRSEITNFELSDNRTDLESKFSQDGYGPDNNRAAIGAALQTSHRDVDRLIAAMVPQTGDTRQLTLTNLSRLHRAASLARALRLSIEDFLSLRDIAGIHPEDPDTADPTKAAIHFIKAARQVESSGFSIEEIDYILRHQVRPNSGIAPDDAQIAQLLEKIRKGLQDIRDDNRIVQDPDGELVARKLAQLNWDDTLVEPVIAALKDDISNQVSLETDPAHKIPDEWQTRLSYDAEAEELRFRGWMTESEKTELEKLFNENEDWKKAIETLFDAPQSLVNRYLRTFDPTYTVAFEVPDGDFDIPVAWQAKLSYDADAKELRFRGWMTESEKIEVEELFKENEDWKTAIDTLYGLPEEKVESQIIFLDNPADSLKNLSDAGQRFEVVLKKLLPHVHKVSSQILLKPLLGEALGLDAMTTDRLLLQYLDSASAKGGNGKAIEPFQSEAFVDSTRALRAGEFFDSQFATYRRLHKAAMLIKRLRIEPGQLEWLFDNSPLDLNALPLEPSNTSAEALFAGFSDRVDLFASRDRVGGEVVAGLRALITTETQRVCEELNRITGWLVGDINILNNEKLLSESGNGSALRRFMDRLDVLKRLGVSAETAGAWSKCEVSSDVALAIKQAAKAKYDQTHWLEVARPLRDRIREKQRATLVAYLMAKRGLKDSHALYQHYLIDVDMSPCMMTSRTKLAIGAVQLFVQRLLMNLEDWRIPQDQAGFCKKQWQGLKNYRVWEANRKVFLYPENWIEPDLRKDKTELFRDLESDLLQGELTASAAEQALRGYLERLDELARLEICGLFHEKETDQPNDGGSPTVDVLHVFGRTQSMPKVYYYRRRAHGLWTPWQKVEAAIDGDHLIPVVFDRRLYLFWPVFTEATDNDLKDKEGKPLKTKLDKDETDATDNDVNDNKGKPLKTKLDKDENGVLQTWEFWKVRLAFSEYRQGMWSPQKILEGTLPIDLPPEEIDPDKKPPSLGNNEKRQRARKFDFTFRTMIEDTSATILCVQRKESKKDKGQAEIIYNNQGGFRFTNDERLAIVPKNDKNEIGLFPPVTGARYYNMMLLAKDDFKNLNIKIKDDNSSSKKTRQLLGKTPRRGETPRGVRLICSHQLPKSEWLDAFIYQDDDRTFLVTNDVPPPGPAKVPSVNGSSFPLTFTAAPRSNQGAKSDTTQKSNQQPIYRFENFYHPAVSDFIRRLNRDGLKGLLRRSEQEKNREAMLFWLGSYEKKFFCSQKVEDISRIICKEHEQVLIDRGLDTDTKKSSANVEPSNANSGPWKITFKSGANTLWGCVVREEDGALLVYQDFDQQYAPTENVSSGFKPEGEVDFSLDGAYSCYNWELFFHVPLLLADRLSKNQRFEEAQEWFHHIFDPTDHSGEEAPQRYWKVAPFYEEAQGVKIIELLELMSYKGKGDEFKKKKEEIVKQIEHWRKSPFDPHVIARFRISAYQKTVVMKYLDNLIAWADQLFRRDTIESINEATQLYILAAEILGKRPLSIAVKADAPSQSFEQLKDPENAYHDAFIAIENVLPVVDRSAMSFLEGSTETPASQKMPYFCVPGNENLLSYWDTVDDRLFKIRHCRNIEGTERQLALFEPPIEPGLLVRAAAAGVDISSALRDINAPLPHYRFNVMLKKAIEFCDDVKALGATFLAALENRDAEDLERLCMGQRSFDLQRSIKQKLIEEAKQNEADLEEAKEQIEERIKSCKEETDYWKLIKLGTAAAKSAVSATQSGKGAYDTAQGARGSKFEKKAADKRQEWESEITKDTKQPGPAAAGLVLASTMYGLAGGSSAIPTVITGGAGISSPVALVKTGGGQVKSWFETAAKVAETVSHLEQLVRDVREIIEEYGRAEKEAKRKKKEAEMERDQMEKRISAARIRVEIAELEKKKIEKEVENAEQVDAYMRGRFTNLELYNWRVSQLSSLYFQTYQMAYDLAKRAEKAFRYELGETDTDYIRFGYWDSLKKGLLAGEQLYFDLKRMEKAYLEQNKRGYEITKHVSLATLAPDALIKLMGNGQCFLDLPEMFFDLDYPGHYRRRIRSVSVTVDCGGEPAPHMNVNCTLTLLKNAVRMDNATESGYERDGSNPDSRFRDEVGAVQSIVTSSGREDSGLFQLDFHDDRYLPFEGAGAISSWKIELPHAYNSIDVRALSDLVLTVKYTARDGGGALKSAATTAIEEKLKASQFVRWVSVKDEFPEQWEAFLDNEKELKFDLGQERFPPMFRGKQIKLKSASLFLETKPGADDKQSEYKLKFGKDETELTFKTDGSPIAGFHYARITDLGEPGEMSFTADDGSVPLAENMLLVIGYTIK